MKMTDKSKLYKEEFALFKKSIERFSYSEIYENTVESMFESLNDWSLFSSIDEVKNWFIEKRENAPIKIKDIPLNKIKGWLIDKKTGNLKHESNEFFTIHGVRVETEVREIKGGWDQPILEQVGYDGGIVGIIRKRFNGIPHYLCEAKMEPGNYGKVQISPTLQATFSNINKAHHGRKPHYVDFFKNSSDYKDFKVLFDTWLAEDGGRLYLKRNRGMLIEVPEDFKIEIPSEYFIWLSLYQIKELLKEDAWINPHTRGILSYV